MPADSIQLSRRGVELDLSGSSAAPDSRSDQRQFQSINPGSNGDARSECPGNTRIANPCRPDVLQSIRPINTCRPGAISRLCVISSGVARSIAPLDVIGPQDNGPFTSSGDNPPSSTIASTCMLSPTLKWPFPLV